MTGNCISTEAFQRLEELVRERGGSLLMLDREPHATTVRSDRPLWDNSLVALILVGLLGFEWILRRRYDLR